MKKITFLNVVLTFIAFELMVLIFKISATPSLPVTQISEQMPNAINARFANQEPTKVIITGIQRGVSLPVDIINEFVPVGNLRQSDDRPVPLITAPNR